MLSSAPYTSTEPPHHTYGAERTATTTDSRATLESIFHPNSPPSPHPSNRRLKTRSSTSSHNYNSSSFTSNGLPKSAMTTSSASPAPASMPAHPNVFFSAPSSKAKAQSASAQIRNETNFNTFRMTPPPSASSRRRQQQHQQQSSASSLANSVSVQSLPGSVSTPTILSSPQTTDAVVPEGERVLQTPRRGRRLGGVEMGWENSHDNAKAEVSVDSTASSSSATSTTPASSVAAGASATATADIPRDKVRISSRPDQDLNPVRITPRKRRSPHGISSSASSSPTKRSNSGEGEMGPSLRDEAGYATAVYPASASGLRSPEHAADGSSDLFEAPPTAPARFDRLAAFRVAPSTTSTSVSDYERSCNGTSRAPCNLVAVDVKGMGRVAVAREVAVQLGAMSEEELKASQAEIGCQDDFVLGLDNTIANRTSHGYASSSQLPSSLDTPGYSMNSAGYLGPSPSFSLASHFPMSEEGSPSLRARALPPKRSTLDAATLNRVLAFKEKLNGPMASSLRRSSTQANLLQSESVAPATNTSLPSSSSLPSLAWPDALAGPWTASIEAREQSEARLDVVSRWLDGDDDGHQADDGWIADDETAQPHHIASGIFRARAHCHPMVAKVIRDRNRKSILLASSASMPDLHSGAYGTPKRRGRKSKGGRRGRPRNELKTPIKRHVFTPSSLSRSIISSGGRSDGSFIGCLCGNSVEDSPMVQCDGCQVWYHMRCAGIRRPEDLEETWYCQPCVVDPSSSHTRRLLTISPASTVALANLHASGGSYASSTPGLLGSGHQGSLAAFPRTYATHIGVSTPSAAYPRVKAETLDRLPVFAHEDSPIHINASQIGATLIPSSGSLALAPSPEVDTGDGSSLLRRQHVRGRSRASRIGWHTAEPGSPLDRKSASSLSTFAATTPSSSSQAVAHSERPVRSYGVKQHTSNARGHGESEEEELPSSRTMSPSFFASMRGRGLGAQMRGVPDRTPSPTRPPASATPSRHARSGRSDSDIDPDHADRRYSQDVLSTPSRFWTSKSAGSGTLGHGSTTPGNTLEPLGLHTPSRSTRRREPSGWALSLANFSTPGSARDRELLFGQQSGTDVSGGYSSGLPSLIYSSGSVIGGGGLESTVDEDFPGAHWLNVGSGSPSRSIKRRSRSRMSTAAGNSSEAMIGEAMPSRAGVLTPQAAMSSVRSSTTSTPLDAAQRRRQPSSGRKLPPQDSSDGYDDQAHDAMDPPTSSSPYPRTPSMDLGYSSANRFNMRGSGGASTPGSPTPSRGKMTLGPFGAGGGNAQTRSNFRKSMSINGPHGAGLALADAVNNKAGRRPPSGDMSALAARSRQASAQHFDPSGPPGLGLGLDLDDVLQFY
ncbi:hypothetical protein BCV69DRAFT_296482 [Microstroma glucosiphilum]|uniref:PHD-type domain-containing protein n=1 Tax=Pseudomicrostroma glucosiphilum TaxID=1684307 RepID=A0A316UGY9_9BASI|nr:hypothetical protein BCV69DRAFT_296482 [Pseudomicrostroma glucosiphilum]PWN24194.1 hypothetical protein BCV69DRAFT_296482 [Pseudomicrostroma glucosiphilum]